MTTAFRFLTVALAFAALSCSPRLLADGLTGEPAALELSERLLETLGGRRAWDEARTIQVELRGFYARERDPWTETFWMELEQPRGRFELEGGEVDRIIAWSSEGGWELSGSSLETMDEDRHTVEMEYWKRQPAVIFHRLARGVGTRVAIADEGRRLEVLDTASGELLAAFGVNLRGEPTQWTAKIGDRDFAHVLGPLADFGPIRFPRWGADAEGVWRYENLAVALSQGSLPVSIEAPEAPDPP